MKKELPPKPKRSLQAGHPVLGVLFVACLYVGLFGVDFLLGADLRVMGVGDAATAQKVMARYGELLFFHQGRVLGCYAALGVCVGAGIQALVFLWERFAPVSPQRWPLFRRLWFSGLCALGLHVFLLSRAIILRPALFAETLFERGGWSRRAMVFLTHGAGGVLVWTLGVSLLLFVLLVPFLSMTVKMRPRRRNRWAVGCGVILTGLLVWAWPPKTRWFTRDPAAPKPSLLLIAVDSLRKDRLFAPRQMVAPAMTRLGTKSVAFEQAFVSVPRTFPSFVSLLTGRAPYHHGIRTMFPTLAERLAVPPALPKRLVQQGYRTAVYSDFCGEIFSRVDLGFSRISVPAFDAKELLLQRGVLVHRNLLPYVSGAGLGQTGLRLGRWAFPELEGVSELADPKLLAERALSYIADAKNQPFFLTVFFSTAHFPYAAPAPYYRRFLDPKYRGPFLYYKPPLTDVAGPEDVAAVQALYDGSVAAADAGVERLLDGLKALGRDRDTIVVLLSDHGENLYDEPGRGMGHGDHLEGDHAVNVPWFVYDPIHRFEPKTVRGLVRDLDFVPTMLGLLGLAGPQNPGPAGLKTEAYDGVDLGPLLRGEKQTLGLSALVETELWFTPSGPGFSSDQRLPYPDVTSTTDIGPLHDIAVSPQYRDLVTVAKHRALRTEQFKIIYRPTRRGPNYSLFDVSRDPRQIHDLAQSEPTLFRQQQAALFQALRNDPTVEIADDFILPKPAISGP